MILAQTVHEIYSRAAVVCRFSTIFLNFDNCQPEVVCDIISGMVDQDVGIDICASFGDSRLKPLEASFSAHF